MAFVGSAPFRAVVAVVVVVFMATALAPHANAAVSCGVVAQKLGPCIGYLTGKGPRTGPCCNGVRALKAMAATPGDRKVACQCLKTIASNIRGINYKSAAALPGQCGAPIPYPISPNTDCSRVR